MKIDVSDVIANSNERRNWNDLKLEDITFIYDGLEVTIPKDEIEEFTFTGLSNTDFILSRDWPENPEYS